MAGEATSVWALAAPWLAGGLAVALAVALAGYGGLSRQFRVLRGAFDSTQAGHAIVDTSGRVLRANRAMAPLLDGRPLAHIDELAALFARDPLMFSRFERVRRSTQEGVPISIEMRRRHETPEGMPAVAWWLISTQPLRAGPGRSLWRIEDVSTQRETEALLREEQLKLVDFLDHAPIGFYSVDQQGAFLFANATLARWLGVDARDLVRGSATLGDFLAEDAQDAARSLVPDPGSQSSVEVPMRSVTGRVFPAAITQSVVMEEDGRIWTRSVVRDLTADSVMRQALLRSEARFQRFFEEAPIGVAQIDREHRLVEWNPAFARLLEQAGHSPSPGPILDVFRPDDRPLLTERFRAVAAGASIAAPVEAGLAGPSVRLVSVFVRRLLGGDGPDKDGLILQFIDQTEQRALEMQIAHGQKMQAVGQLAGGIAHDFNNLLTAMIGFCDLLLIRHRPGDPSFGDLMQIKQNANRAANLVRQLLAFSRQQTLTPRVLDLTDALAELTNLIRRLIGENIALNMRHGRDLWLIKVDQGQLEQVIINLAVNARDAMPDGGSLTIETGTVSFPDPVPIAHGSESEIPPGDYVSIMVRDSGTGIPPDILDRIFDPFFSTKEVGQGTGLGLSTVYGIVRQTGGHITVDTAVGDGTCFTIYLPRHAAPKASAVGADQPTAGADPPPAAAPEDLTGIETVLLVEDEDPVRMFSARALEKKGYQVHQAASGAEAIALLDTGPGRIDLVITDVVMPNMDGPTLVAKIRDRHPEMKFICISGYAEDRFREQLDAASVHFLAKPFSLQQLAGKVKAVLDEP